MAMDPICNMNVDEATAQWTYEYEGRTYYFCAPGCKAAFSQDPTKWTGGNQGHSHHRHGCCGGH
jgi:YHS domain-containing protein